MQENDATPDVWRDVLDEAGQLKLFTSQTEARASLNSLFPVLVKLEAFGVDRKRTRVIVVSPYDDIDNPKDD